jgi:hypothetical protein
MSLFKNLFGGKTKEPIPGINLMNKRLSNLQIRFSKGWQDISEDNPLGPPTFINCKLEDFGVLQISMAEYMNGQVPNSDFSDLITLSKNIGIKNGFGIVRHEESGTCGYGKYGFVQFSKSEFPYIAVWHLSDGRSFIFATFICATQPDPRQIHDVKTILTSIKKRSILGSLFK